MFAGEPEDVAGQEKKIYKIAAATGGLAAGKTNGERGYTLTFVIAYIRVSGHHVLCMLKCMHNRIHLYVIKPTFNKVVSY